MPDSLASGGTAVVQSLLSLRQGSQAERVAPAAGSAESAGDAPTGFGTAKDDRPVIHRRLEIDPMTTPTERRLAPSAADLQLRLVGDGMTFEGYAAVFDSDSEPLPGWGVERIAPGAFRRSLSEESDIRMFLNHNTDDLLASTKAGTLRLSEDEHGLRVQADLPDTQAGRDLATLIRRGDVRSMSFGFQPEQHEPRTDGVSGTVHTAVRLLEVSPVTSWPAYSATSASVRTMETADDFDTAQRRVDWLYQQAARIGDTRPKGSTLTRSKERDLADMRTELLNILDAIPADVVDVTNRIEHKRNWIVRDVDPSDPDAMRNAADAVSAVVRLARGDWERKHGPNRDVYERLDRILESHERPNMTRTSSIAPLWDQYRTTGFAATELSYSAEFTETRAMSTPGGTAIATTFADQVVVFQRTLNPMLNPAVVTISTSGSGAPFKVPRLTADVSLGGTVTAEAAAITEADPTISAAELTPYKYGGITLWSAELDQDEIIDLEPLIARSHARAIAIGAGAHLTTGDGSGKPTGFITSATNGGTATVTFGGTASTFFDYGDLVDLWGSLAAPYRSVGVWQLSTDAFVKIQRFRDDNGNLAILPGLNGGPPTLLGRPVFENPAMAAVGSASKSVSFGDFQQYWVRRVAPLRIELSRDYKYATDQVALKVVDRLDGELIDTAAVAYMVSADA